MILRRLAAIGTVVALATVLASTSAEAAGPMWRIQPTGTPAGSKGGAALNAVSCPTATFCEAVGTFSNTVGTQVTLTEDWTPTAGWKFQQSPNAKNAFFDTLWGVSCLSATKCEAVGQYLNGSNGFFDTLAEVWNGHAWIVQPTPNPTGSQSNLLNSVSCASATFCEAVGDASPGGAGTSTLVENWNGTKWAVQKSANSKVPNNELEGVACPSITLCVAVGLVFNKDAGASLAEVLQKGIWQIQPTKDPTGSRLNGLFGVACVSTTSCEAVGQFKTTHVQPMADSWNGTAWKLQVVPNPNPTGQGDLQSVSCPPPPATAYCAAVGTYNSSTGVPVALAEQWTGTKWITQPAPNPANAKDTDLGSVSCMAQSAPVCVAVGAASNVPPPSIVPYTLAERYS